MKSEHTALQEQLLKSKLEIVADRNERFAIIIKKLDKISEKIRQDLKGK